jgi:hypothetical protein
MQESGILRAAASVKVSEKAKQPPTGAHPLWLVVYLAHMKKQPN